MKNFLICNMNSLILTFYYPQFETMHAECPVHFSPLNTLQAYCKDHNQEPAMLTQAHILKKKSMVHTTQ